MPFLSYLTAVSLLAHFGFGLLAIAAHVTRPDFRMPPSEQTLQSGRCLPFLPQNLLVSMYFLCFAIFLLCGAALTIIQVSGWGFTLPALLILLAIPGIVACWQRLRVAFLRDYRIEWDSRDIVGPSKPSHRFARATRVRMQYRNLAEIITKDKQLFGIRDVSGRELVWDQFYLHLSFLEDRIRAERPDLFEENSP